ncbi:MAG: SDR family oxidoreductase [Gemmatimonadetes bacterium]|nr:SDR family oxidoreductase [Gemmatimonadota bacterium]
MALVTGSGRRLGAELAVAFAVAGYDVAIHHHASRDGAERTRIRAAAEGGQAAVFQADLREAAEIERLFQLVSERFGRLDCLVNSAAIFPLAPWSELTPETWHEVLAVNLTAPFLCVRAAEPLLRAAGGGHVVNVVDLGAFEAWIDRPANGVSKAGLLKLTQSLARALAPDILVNAVAPGTIHMPEEPAPYALPSPRRLPLRRWGAPEDVAEAVLFLARTRHVTGQCIVVDGGKLLL